MDGALHRTAYGTNPHSRGGGRADEISRIAERVFGMRGGRVELPADSGGLLVGMGALTPDMGGATTVYQGVGNQTGLSETAGRGSRRRK